MTQLLSIGTKARSINVVQIAIEFLNRASTKELLIKMNTEDQLFGRGEDSDGVKLSGKSGLNWVVDGEYSLATINGTSRFEGKIDAGLPIDRITLKNSGDLYASWRVIIDFPFITFEADDNKGGNNLSDMLQTGIKFLGLQNENKERIEEMVIGHVLNKALNIILS